MTKTSTITVKGVELVLGENLDANEAFASVTANPNIVWAKFVLLDDMPNGNNQRVPETEFDNVIRTGRFMPIKSAEGSIKPDHSDARPLGVITHLQKEANTIVGLAALWIKERYNDVASLKKQFSKDGSVDVSWELSYEDSDIEDGGVVTFKNVIMNAVTIVGIPAYQGRTPIVQMASLDTQEEEIEVETITLEEHAKVVEELKAVVTELQTKEATASEELEVLRKFKQGVEEKEALAAKLVSLKDKFSTAGLNLTETYLEENKEKLLAMSDEVLDFFVQELVAFASKNDAEEKNSEASLKVTTKFPNLDDQKESPQNKSLAELLRELDAKK